MNINHDLALLLGWSLFKPNGAAVSWYRSPQGFTDSRPPAFDTGGNALLVLIEAMRGKGFSLKLEVQVQGHLYIEWADSRVSFATRFDRDAHRMPHAIAVCALEVLRMAGPAGR